MSELAVDIFQLLNPAAPAVKDQDVAVPRAKLPRPPLLRGIECDEGQLLDP
jgi:hypothetical protein